MDITRDTDQDSTAPSVSADGMRVAFATRATNLAETSGAVEGLVYDRRSGKFSVTTSAGKPAENGPPWISPDGTFVSFWSSRSLESSDRNGVRDYYRLEIASRRVQRVSQFADPQLDALGKLSGAIAPDGTRGVFELDHQLQMYFVDASSGASSALSADGAGSVPDLEVTEPAFSSNGKFLVFTSAATNFLDIPRLGEAQAYVQDLTTQRTEPVSVSSSGLLGNYHSAAPAISGDGARIAFQSAASNLVDDDSNEVSDIFVRDRRTGTTRRISVASDGTQANGSSFAPAISADGRYVAFLSHADNLTPGDHNQRVDVYVHKLASHRTVRVSVDASGKRGGGSACDLDGSDCPAPALSADGTIVVFQSSAGDLAPGSAPGRSDIYWVAWQRLPLPVPPPPQL